MGEKSEYRVKVKGGVPPYRYEWFINDVRQVNAKREAMIVTWPQPGTYRLGIAVYDSREATDKIADTITVLSHGEVLAEGNYAEVSQNPQVMEAYMGTTATELQGAH